MAFQENSLERGDAHAGVQTLQRHLIREEGSALEIFGDDGKFGAETEEAVQNFQLKYNISNPDGNFYGVAGPATQEKLLEVNVYRNGASGRGVEMLQEALMQFTIDLPQYGADGQYGNETENAVRTFQEHNELVVDGIAGSQTFNIMDQALNVDLVRNGDSGPVYGSVVRTVQQALVENEINVSIDGIFGPETEAGVRDFQEENNLDVDGIVGPITMAFIYMNSSIDRMSDQEINDLLEEDEFAEKMFAFVSEDNGTFIFESDNAQEEGYSSEEITEFERIIDEMNEYVSTTSNSSFDVSILNSHCEGRSEYDQEAGRLYVDSCTMTDILSYADLGREAGIYTGIWGIVQSALRNVMRGIPYIATGLLFGLGRWRLNHAARHDCGVVFHTYESQLLTGISASAVHPYHVASQC